MTPKINKLIAKYDIDLSGLTVLTEGASGAYLLNPFIALAAGASEVICKVKASSFGTVTEITGKIYELADKYDCKNKIIVKEHLDQSDFDKIDIVTNSGHVRPIDKAFIEQLKSTAVIPLMWETWEYRESDFDLKTCKKKEVLVLGTDESNPPCDMSNYSATIGVKLLFEMGVEIAGNKIVMLGSTETLCASIRNALVFLGAEVIWFSNDKAMSGHHYDQMTAYLENEVHNVDALLLAEHHFPAQLFGKNGYLSFLRLKELNSELKIGICSGNIDEAELKASELFYFPKEIQPFGFMSYQCFHVGSLAVMDLFAAGLKVGEAMSRARLSGMSIQKAAQYALKHSPAQDFQGDLAWL